MREVVLDTETTGLNPEEGHRVVEIGAVELNGHLPTGRTFHEYINPKRSMPEEALAVHGLSEEFLSRHPPFEHIGQQFLDFIGDARLVIHNAAFDMAFLNAELKWMGLAPMPMDRAIDTVEIARRKFPGSPASLDALCRRFGIDNSAREKHGALLDSELLAEVYLELVGGRQPDFRLSVQHSARDGSSAGTWRPSPREVPLPPRLTAEESAAHAAFIDELGEASVWRRFG